ncbi:MAG TPA: redoxin domain-containing protein [Gaiellaceae bacterium]|nr:redoxin domain-containing protein [Gaiellaceae bacterium]
MRLLRDRRAEFELAGVRVYGVSRDSHWSHRAWKEALGIDVELISDWNGSLVKRFGASQTRRWMEGVPRRSAFLVGEDGTVLRSWRYEDSEVPDFDELLAAARALRG